QLFIEALGESFAQNRAMLLAAAERAPAPRKLEAVIGAYLSAEHCANWAEGCPFAALATEVARLPRSVRVALEHNARESAGALARLMPGDNVAQRERAALVLFAGMSGALNLARAAPDEELRRTILEDSRAFYSRAVKRSG